MTSENEFTGGNYMGFPLPKVGKQTEGSINDMKKRTLKVRIVNLDDWFGLYVNGKLEDEGHSARVNECLEIIQRETIEPASLDFNRFWADGELDEFGNHCPDNWSDLSIYEGWVE